MRDNTGAGHSLKYLLVACAFALATIVNASTARATDYFLDSIGGDDGGDGHSDANAWRTIAPLIDTTLHAGDNVYFKRGSTFNLAAAASGADGSGLVLSMSESGTEESRITLSAYGTGARPIMMNDQGGDGDRIISISGGYVTVESIEFSQAHYGAVVVEGSGHHVIVRDIETHHLGIGVVLFGENNLVTQNFFRDGTMVVNTPGGVDDYGANGLVVLGSHNEISYNHAERLIAPSEDFTVDGGFCELFTADDASITDISIHHNTVQDSDGFSEIAGNISNVVYAYNETHDNHGFATIQNTLDSDFSNILFTNNTIFESEDDSSLGGSSFWFSREAESGVYTFVNNIVVQTVGGFFQRATAVTHSNNVFSGGARLGGITLGASESSASPMFVNAAADDFHLQAGSVAINAGVAVSFTSDLDGHPVPFGGSVDIGAHEYIEPGTDAGTPLDGSVGFDAGPPPVDMGPVAADMGPPPVDAGVSVDLGISFDAGPPPPDAGPSLVDSGLATDAGRVGSGVDPVSGCSCSAAGTNPTSPLAALVAFAGVLALALRVSRKRR
ncbi:MAG: hypothetical protein IPK60_06050 [Sandaracinaceae bacterium]|nr:hypothetical protein [Sandaracinaceae bacterium]